MSEQEKPQAGSSLRDRQKQQVREELVLAAKHLIERDGFDAVSVDAIVGQAGVAKGTFYLYFKTKSEIVASVLESLVGELGERVAQAIANAPDDAPKALVTIVAAQLEFFKEHPATAPMLLGGGIARVELSEEERSRISEHYAGATTDAYARIIRKGMLQQCFREVDAHLASRALHAMIAGLAQDATASGKPMGSVGAVAVELFERGVTFR